MNCDHCALELQDNHSVVDSRIGLMTWNALHPDDQRQTLHFCDVECTLMAGVKLGQNYMRAIGGRRG
jgi:hypothetical protein